jgi:hypothetical protein
MDTPQPVKPIEPVRDAKDDDAAWDKKEKDYAPGICAREPKVGQCKQKVHGLYKEHD